MDYEGGMCRRGEFWRCGVFGGEGLVVRERLLKVMRLMDEHIEIPIIIL